ncbi:MAG: hypothetical protein WBA74_17265 [Cyclobacteriaceae bacterium]
MLKNAVEDAMYLVFSPLDFFLAEISQKHPSHLAIKSFKSITKYVKINSEPLAEYVSLLEDTGKERLDLDVALQYANDVFENVETSELNKTNFLNAISTVEPISEDEIYLDEEDEAITQPEESEEPAFELDNFLTDDHQDVREEEFSEPSADDEAVELTDDIAETLPEEEITDNIEPQPEVSEESNESLDDTVSSIMEEVQDVSSTDQEEEEDTITNFDDDDIDEFVDTTDIPPIDMAPKGVISNYEEDDEEPEEPAILNKNFASEPVPTINENLKEEEEESLAGKLANKPVDNVFSSISVNQRYMFTNELFGGSGEDFKEAINFVEECLTFDESVELLVQRYAKPYKWDMNSTEVKELLKVIFRKFRD